jgi:hypothetical protein
LIVIGSQAFAPEKRQISEDAANEIEDVDEHDWEGKE